jgi:hypothetical protein
LRAECDEFRGEFPAFFSPAPRHDNMCVLAGKCKGGRAANTAQRAGDEYNRFAGHFDSLVEQCNGEANVRS